MKLGVFTAGCREWEPIEAMEKIAAIGYDGIEFRAHDSAEDPANMTAEVLMERGEELKAKAASLGLAIPSIASYIQCDDLRAVERYLKAAVAVGAGTIRIGSGNYALDGAPCWEQLQTVSKQYAEVARIAADLDVRAVIETHMSRLAPSTLSARMILDGLDPRHVGIMWDPANQVREGLERYDMALDLAGEYLAEVHVKNTEWAPGDVENGRQTWKFDWAPLKRGIVDWPAIIELLKARGYDGWLMFEDFSMVLPLEERLREGHEWFRSMTV